jgi:hypothetical protein
MKFTGKTWLQRVSLVAVAVVFVPVIFAAVSVLAEPQPLGQQGQQAGQQQGPPPDLSRPNGPPVVDPNQKKQDAGSAPVPGTPGKPEAPPPAMPESPDWVTPLRWYEGTWQVKSDPPGAKANTETDTCQTSGKRFYECEHVVDGETVALRLYVPGDQAGHYYTQVVLPSGTALGRNDLLIEGDKWILSNKAEQEDGALNYQRITLVFSGKGHDTVHYTVERSDDGLHWQTSSTGTGRKMKP